MSLYNMLRKLGAGILLAACAVFTLNAVAASSSSGENIPATYNWVQMPLDERIALAQQGNVEAQFNVGYLYLTNTLVKQDVDTAKKWLVEAATQGHVDAMLLLCSELDEPQWGASLMAAAQNGNTQAQENLVDYANSNCFGEMPYNEAEQLKSQWQEQIFAAYERAAQQGDEWAQFKVGAYYRSGEGVEQDREKAAYWWQQSADQGNQLAVLALDKLLDLGNVTDESVIQSLRRRVELHETSAAEMVLLGIFYVDKKEPRNLEKAFVLMSMSLVSTTEFVHMPDLEPMKTLIMRDRVFEMMGAAHKDAQALVVECMRNFSERCY